MTSTGAKFPTAAETVAETPWEDANCTWITPTNIGADDGNTANVVHSSFDAPDQTYVLKAYTFDFSGIPDGSTILGVTARVNAWYRSGQGSGSIDLLQLLDTSRAKVGTNQCATPVPLTTTTTTIITKGSASDLWGNALTVAWVKDTDFGVAIGCVATAANADVDVDYVTLEIEYTAPITGAGIVAGVSTVATAGSVDRPGAGTVAGVSTLTAIGAVTHTGIGIVAGVSTVSAAGTVVAGGAEVTGAGVIAAVSTVASAAQVDHAAAGVVVALSTVAAGGQVDHTGAGIVAGVSTVSAAAQVIYAAAGIVAGASTVTVTVQVDHTGIGTIAAIASVMAAGTVTSPGQVTGTGLVAAESALTGVGVVDHAAVGTIAAVSLLVASGTVVAAWSGENAHYESVVRLVAEIAGGVIVVPGASLQGQVILPAQIAYADVFPARVAAELEVF